MNKTVNQITPGLLGGAIATLSLGAFKYLVPDYTVSNEEAIALGVVFTFVVQRLWSKQTVTEAR